MAKLTPTTKAKLRRMYQRLKAARDDPNAFIEFLELPDDDGDGAIKQAECHVEFQQFLTDNDAAIIQFPREHGKTTQIRLRAIWELGRNPRLRVAYICQNATTAERRVNAIRSLLRGPLGSKVRQVFPGLRFDPEMPNQGTAFYVQRDGNAVDPSLYAMGITGSGTGARADLIILDDVVDPKNSATEGERNKIYERITGDVIQYLTAGGRLWCVCTPWHEDDANARFVNQSREPDSPWKVLQKPIGPNFEPLWPEHWPTERLKKRRNLIGLREFSYGFWLKVISDVDQVYGEIKFYDAEEYEKRQRDPLHRLAVNTYVAVDPAFTTKEYSDYTGVVAFDVLPDGSGHITEGKKARVADKDLVDFIADFADTHGAKTIFVEQAGQAQRLLLWQLREVGMDRHGEQYRVIGLRPKAAGTAWTDLRARAALKSRYFANGTIRLAGVRGPGGMQPSGKTADLHHEMAMFPQVAHDDLVTAATYAAYAITENVAPRPRQESQSSDTRRLSPKGRLTKALKEQNDGSGKPLVAGRIWGWN